MHQGFALIISDVWLPCVYLLRPDGLQVYCHLYRVNLSRRHLVVYVLCKYCLNNVQDVPLV